MRKDGRGREDEYDLQEGDDMDKGTRKRRGEIERH